MYLKKLLPSYLIKVISFSVKIVNWPNIHETFILPNYISHSDHFPCFIVMYVDHQESTTLQVRWFVAFIDDHTITIWVFLVKEKLEVRGILENYHKMVDFQFETTIQFLRINNGREYFH